jgi:ferredoxin
MWRVRSDLSEGAIKERQPSVAGGRLIKKPTIDFDIDSCILCGECAVLCPLNALKMEVDGKENLLQSGACVDQ